MKYTYKPQKKLLGSSTFKMQKSGKFKYLSEILHLAPAKIGGVNICANKYKGIRSALIYDTFSMEMAIRHNCANFFAIPSRGIDYETLDRYLYLCANHTFDGGRHQIRIQELEK